MKLCRHGFTRCPMCGTYPFWIVVALLLIGCPQPLTPPLDGDANTVTVSGTPENVCANWAKLGCLSGADPHCVSVVAHVVDAGLTPFDMLCNANADTQATVMRCKGGSCN